MAFSTHQACVHPPLPAISQSSVQSGWPPPMPYAADPMVQLQPVAELGRLMSNSMCSTSPHHTLPVPQTARQCVVHAAAPANGGHMLGPTCKGWCPDRCRGRH